jgi:hypothetical protein
MKRARSANVIPAFSLQNLFLSIRLEAQAPIEMSTPHEKWCSPDEPHHLYYHYGFVVADRYFLVRVPNCTGLSPQAPLKEAATEVERVTGRTMVRERLLDRLEKYYLPEQAAAELREAIHRAPFACRNNAYGHGYYYCLQDVARLLPKCARCRRCDLPYPRWKNVSTVDHVHRR